MLKPFAAALLLFVAAATAQSGSLDYDTSETAATRPPPKALAEGESRMAQQMFQNGNSMVTAGHILSTGGFILANVGTLAENPALSLIGNISFSIGLPVLGVGAGKVNNAAELQDPGYRADYRGWGWYWTGFVTGNVGVLMLNSVINEANNADTEEEQEEALSKAGFPLILILTGAVCNIVSWVKFARLAGEGRRAAAFNGAAASLDLQPQLLLTSEGKVAPGLKLSYGF